MKRIALALAVLLMLIPAASLAVSFEIADYELGIEVRPDGAGLMTETLLYRFDGAYNGILVTLRHAGGVSLSDLAVTADDGVLLTPVQALDEEPYTYTVETADDETRLKVYAPGEDDERRFQITYRMDGLALRYLDTGRVNYMALRSEADYESARITLVLPGEDAAAIEPFVHGAMGAGDIRQSGGTVFFGPVSLSGGDRVEIDVLFPESWLSGAVQKQTTMREEALEVERQIEEMNAEAAKRAAERERTLRVALLAVLGAYAVLFALILWRQSRIYGFKSPDRPVMDEPMLGEIPAALAQVLKDGGVSASGLSATLLELTEKRFLSERQEEGDTCFTLLGPPEGLMPHQAALVDWLFAGQNELWISALDAGDDYGRARAFVSGYGEFQNAARQDAYDLGWLFRNGFSRAGLGVLSLLLGLIVAAACLSQELFAFAAAAAVLSVLLSVQFFRLRRLTDAGEARRNALMGLMQTQMDRLETSPEAVLPHAPLLMALGAFEPLAEWIDRHPEVWDDGRHDWMPPVWMAAGWHTRAMEMDRTIRAAERHNVHVPDPDASKGNGGSGGGFSGGSGGGSSHGAW